MPGLRFVRGYLLTGNNHRMAGSSQPPPGGLAAGSSALRPRGMTVSLVTAPAGDG